VVRRPQRSTVLLLCGLAAPLAPLVLLPLVLTQDGPAHVDGAWVLLHHGDDSAVGRLLREHYAVDLSPVPNMLTTLVLALLLTVLGPGAAEKVLVTGFVLLLVGGLHYALRGVDRRAGWLAVAALPLAGGRLVAYGFYNFCWGVALALVVAGWALRHRDGWSPRSAGVLGLLLLVLWGAHLLPWVGAAALVVGLGAGRVVADARSGSPTAAALGRHLAGPALALLPSVALTVRYVLSGDGEHGAAVGGPSLVRLGWLLTLYRPLVVASWWELAPAVLVAVVLAGLLVVALRRPRSPSPTEARARADRVVLGVATTLAVAAFMLSPTRLGDEFGFLPDRLAWFPPLLLVLFAATRPPGRAVVRGLAAAAIVVAAGSAVLVRLPTELRDQRDAAELLSVAADLPAGSTFVVLRFSGHQAALAPLDGEPDPLRHLSSRLAVEARGVDVGHYEAIYPYFQVRFTPSPGVRQAIDPGLRGLDTVPPTVDLPAAGEHLDYVLVVGLDRAENWARDARRTVRVLADLRAGAEEVAVSRPSGYVSLWRLQSGRDG
jgi:hypothetical protein